MMPNPFFLLNFSVFFPSSGSVPFRLPPPSPMPGIHPTGAVTRVANVSGTMSSLSLSPAERMFRPTTFAARAPFGMGLVKFDERSVRWVVGCRAGALRGAGEFDLSIGPWLPPTISFCKATIRRSKWAGRYSFAYQQARSLIDGSEETSSGAHQSDQAIRVEGMLARKHVELPGK